MKALDIFVISMIHIKEKLLYEMNGKYEYDIYHDDIEFVLTVPAIWGDTGKLFMQEAAVQVGI